MEDKIYLYAAREIETGKLVSDITNPRRKYWDRKGNAIKAIESYNNSDCWHYNKGNYGKLELVTFELVEIKNDSTSLP